MTITVVSQTQIVTVDPVTTQVSVTNSGPQGPAGIGGVASYSHIQTIVSGSWLINHNLGFNPSVDAIDASGNNVEGHVIFHTLNQLEIQFLTPRAGTARLS